MLHVMQLDLIFCKCERIIYDLQLVSSPLNTLTKLYSSFLFYTFAQTIFSLKNPNSLFILAYQKTQHLAKTQIRQSIQLNFSNVEFISITFTFSLLSFNYMNFLTRSVFRGISNVSGQSANNMKRFYKDSTFKLNQKPAHPMHKYIVKLDEKSMKTPYRHTLAVPSKALALMISNQFNRQEKLLKTIEMPILSLSRTAVDADIEGHLAEHLKNTIYSYLRTDTLLFYENKFDKRYKSLVLPLIQNLRQKFNMKIEPSDSLQPPLVQISKEFNTWLDSLNNWQLIGLQTMVVWMKSSICACSVVLTNFDPVHIQAAAYLQETTQMQQFGQVQQRKMDINQIRLMVSCGQMMYRFSED